MLRSGCACFALGVGWSAEKLSQEYGTGGAGELTRTTIAKIERDIRLIKAGEVDGVARVFGLTANDLLDTGRAEGIPELCRPGRRHRTGGHGLVGRSRFPATSPPMARMPWGLAQRRRVPSTPHRLLSCCSRRASCPRRGAGRSWTWPCGVSGSCSPRVSLPTSSMSLQVTAGIDLDDSGLSSYFLIDLPTPGDRSRDVALSKLGGSILSSARVPDVRVNPLIHVPARSGIPGPRRGTWACT